MTSHSPRLIIWVSGLLQLHHHYMTFRTRMQQDPSKLDLFSSTNQDSRHLHIGTKWTLHHQHILSIIHICTTWTLHHWNILDWTSSGLNILDNIFIISTSSKHQNPLSSTHQTLSSSTHQAVP